MDIQLVTKATLKEDFESRMKSGGVFIGDPVIMTPPILGRNHARANEEELYKAAMDARVFGYQPGFRFTRKYGTPYDVPRRWADGSTMSVREAIRKGKLSLRDAAAASNTLMPDWENLWEAIRLDLTIRKTAIPTIRQYLYNELNRPEATRDVRVSEIYPYGIVFEENNGEGQPVPQGETRAGGTETVHVNIYAAGFTWTLLAELFDQSLDMGRLSDAVAVGYNARRDDLGIAPILAFVYAGVQQTAAAVLAGANRQELLYLTLEDAIDDLGTRLDPITGRPLDVSRVVILASELDARHIARVAGGLPSTNERNYPMLSEITRVLGYNGESIPLRDRVVQYAGVTAGTAYMIVPNRYLNIVVKRGLTVEVDPLPDVKTLAREERAYWFAEGIHTDGIATHVQEITLPAW